jgi:predicted DNA-binding transcriptional regulator YafY
VTRKVTPLLSAEAARLLRIERRLAAGNGATFAELEKMLAVSAATLKRDLRILREQLDAPIEYDRNGYRYSITKTWCGVVCHLLTEVGAQ